MGLDPGVNLGTAYADIEVNFNKFTSNLESALDQADRTLTSRLESISSKLQGIGSELTKAFAPATGFAALGLKEFSDFDAILTEIEARTGATASQMETVKKTALEMGQNTAFSATDSAQAMLELLASGYDINETLTALTPVLNAAAAGQLQLGESADAVTDILAAYGLGAENASMVSDILTKSSGASSATMRDMVGAFSNVGPIARQFNLSVEDTAAILALFAENGIKAEEGGTQLKSLLTNLARTTPEVQEQWEALGISLYDSEGNVRNLNEVIQDLNNAMDGMTEQQQIETVQTLAGSFGQLGLNALLASDGYEGMLEKMEEATGAAVVAEKNMNSFKGVIDQVKNAVVTLSLVALGPLAEKYLIPAAKAVAELVNRFTDFLMQHPAIAEALGVFIFLLGIAGPLVYGLGTFIGILATVLGILTSPLFLVVAALAGLYLAVKNNILGMGKLSKGFDAIADAVKDVGKAFKKGGITEAFATAKEEAAGLFASAKTGLQVFGKAFVSFVQNELPGHLATLASMGSKLWGWVEASLPELSKTVGTALGKIVRFIADGIIKYGPDALKALLGLIVLVGAWLVTTGIPELAGLALNASIGFINGFVEGLTGQKFSITQAVSSVFSNLMSGVLIEDMANWVWQKLISPVINAITGYVAANGGLWNTAKMIGSTILEAGASAIGGAAAWVWNHIIQPIITAIQGYVIANGGLWNTAKTIGEKILGAATSGITGVGMWVWNNIIQPIIAGIQTYTIENGGLWNTAKRIMVIIFSAALAGRPEVNSWVATNIMTPIAVGILNAIVPNGGFWNTAKKIGGTILEAAASGASAPVSIMQWLLTNIFDRLVGGIQVHTATGGNLYTTAKNIGSKILEGAAAGITGLGSVAMWVWNNVFFPIIGGIQQYVMTNGGLWNTAKTIGVNILGAAVVGLGNVLDWVQTNVIDPLVSAIGEKVAEEGGLWNVAKTLGSNMMNAAKAGIGNLFDWVVSNLSSPLANFLTVLIAEGSDLWSGLLDVGQGIVDGIKAGIEGGWDAFESWVLSQLNGIIERAKGALGIFSPSRVFAEMGGQIVAGLQMGMSDFGPVLGTVDRLASAMQTPLDAMAGAKLQPAFAGAGGGSTTNITVNVTPPGEVLGADRATVQENAQLWGDTFADRLMGRLRAEG